MNDRVLTLDRYPPQQKNRSLLAWDAADELLYEEVVQRGLKPDTRLLLINDTFGALTCLFAEQKTMVMTDSKVSQLGIEHNFGKNFPEKTLPPLLSALDEVKAHFDYILIKLPKQIRYLEYLLAMMSGWDLSKTQVILSGKAKDIPVKLLKRMERYFTDVSTSLAVKKSRLVFLETAKKGIDHGTFQTYFEVPEYQMKLHHHANVFSNEKLDLGARAFLPHIFPVGDSLRVIDLGCGNGVLGVHLLKSCPQVAQVTFVDESHMAVESARLDVQENCITREEDSNFVVDDCLSSFSSGQADLVLCNPPFHQQNAVTDHIAWQMFQDAKRVLRSRGELRVVGNRHLGYHVKLKRIFGNVTTVASNHKFVILSATKRS